MELFAHAVRALGRVEGEEFSALKATLKTMQAYFMSFLDLAKPGFEMAKEGVAFLETHDDPMALVLAYNSLALNAYFLNRYEEEIKIINKMVKIAVELDDKWLLAFALYAASLGALIIEDLNEAKRLGEWNLALCEDIGDIFGSTLPLITLGYEAFGRGDYKNAREYYHRGLQTSEEFGFHYSIETISKYLGKVEISLGNFKLAKKYLHRSLEISNEIFFIRDTVNLLYEYARLFASQNDPEGAVELLQIVLMHPVSSQARLLEGPIRDSASSLLSKLKVELPSESFEAAVKRGKELELDAVVFGLLEAGY